MKRYFLVSVILVVNNICFACGNEYFSERKEMPLINGNLVSKFLLEFEVNSSTLDVKDEETLPYWSNGFDIKDLVYQSNELLANYNKTKDFKYLSDYAWVLVKLGNPKEAINILDSLLKTHPNEYNILANLGTSYELVGNNKKAFELLTKAVEINKESHYGSEWIHLNILKYKIDKEKFPIENIISLVNYSSEDSWNLKSWNYKISEDSLLKNIAYQLHERIGFIKPKDAIIGQLIFEFAHVIAKTKGMNEAILFYNFALFYNNDLYNNVKWDQRTYKEPKIGALEKTNSKNWGSNSELILLFSGGVLLSILSFMLGRKTARK